MKNILLKFGKYAHGTNKNLGKINIDKIDNKEYALRPRYNDKCWNELLQFRIDEYSI